MNLLINLFTSSVGKKFVMAVTGLALFGFVVAHLAGNLQIFLGAETLNSYGHFLQSKPALVWSARIGLLACVMLHIVMAVRLSAENKAARSVGYAGNPVPSAASYASRTMLMSGLIIAAFIIYHLLHFTVRAPAVNFTGQDFGALQVTAGAQAGYHDLYRMMVLGFSKPLVSLFYLVAMALLCLHLSHGVAAMFQSLGLKNQAYGPALDLLGKAASILIFAGYASIPLAVLVGIVK